MTQIIIKTWSKNSAPGGPGGSVLPSLPSPLPASLALFSPSVSLPAFPKV